MRHLNSLKIFHPYFDSENDHVWHSQYCLLYPPH